MQLTEEHRAKLEALIEHHSITVRRCGAAAPQWEYCWIARTMLNKGECTQEEYDLLMGTMP